MAVGSSTGRGHRGSQDSYEWEQYGLDPSVSPGLARPRGWRVGLPDGTAAWDKTGPLDTDWTPVGAATPATAPATLVEKNLTNTSGVQIDSARVVHLAGDLSIAVAQANSAANCRGTVGIASVDIAPGGTADVYIVGEAQAIIDSTLYPPGTMVAGDQAWLSATEAGAITNVRPTANAVHVGVVKAVLGNLALLDLQIYDDTRPELASWDPALCRVYAIDGVNGDDTNRGYADPTATGAAAYAVACAAAGAVAKKTIAGLAAIFPRSGAGRMVEVVIAAATYTQGLELLLDGVTGYAFGSPTIRGTITNATAGSVAFAGSSADATMAGGVTVPGLNAAGYNPTGSPTTTVIQCLKVGGAAPAFGAEPAVPMGWRIRFDAATATAALRNQCRQVCLVSGTNTVFPQTALPAVPVAGDVFYLEQPGVVVPAFTLPSILGAPPNTSLGIQFAGIRWTGNSAFSDIRARFSFCGTTNCFANGTQGGGTVLTVAQTYTHPVLGLMTIGGGLRNENTGGTTFQISNLQAVLAGLVCVGAATFGGIAGATNVQWGAGCAARNLILANCLIASTDGSVPTSIATAPNVGTTATVGIPRLFGNASVVPLLIDGCNIRIGAMTIVNAGGSPCIKLAGINRLIFSGTVAGTTGNTDVGLDLQNAVQSLLEFRSGGVPTVTGSTFGDIRMAGTALASWANLDFEELYDQAGNHLYFGIVNGAAYNAAMSPSVYSGVVNNGAAISGYCLVAIQAASGQVRWATADTIAHAAGLVGALLAGASNGAACLYAASGYKVVQFDGGAVTPGAVAYLSDSLVTPGVATCTVPAASATAAKLRLGVVVDNGLPFNLGIIRFSPDNYPVLADGLP
jgi:hypothetical protein